MTVVTAWHPVEFASRKLNNAEQNYSNIEREGLSIVFGVEKSRHYLLGTHFTIRNNQIPLRKLLAFDSGVPIHLVQLDYSVGNLNSLNLIIVWNIRKAL